MKAVPRRLLVLGGGSAGVELAQVVRRLGGEAVLVEGADRVLPREPAPLGEALAEALRRDGIELMLGMHASAARRDGDEFVLRVRRRSRSCGATGCSWPPVGARASRASASRPSASRPTPRGIQVDEHLRAGERLWAIGDVTGIWPLTHVGEYEGDVVAANIAGDAHPANYEAVPRVTYTDPQAAAVGAIEAPYSATALVSEVPKTATYTHAYAESNGFLTLLSDGERLTGAYALGPEAGEWLQQATLAIRAHVPLEVLGDTIQPFPSFSGIYDTAVMALRMEIADKPRPVTPMDAQMASLSMTLSSRVRPASTARPDRRPDRRQRRHRPRDRPTRPQRGRRRRPHRPRSRAARAGSARRRRAEHRRLRRHRRGGAEAVLRRAAGPDRPRAGHRPRPELRASARDGRRSGARGARRPRRAGARGRAQRRAAR